MTNASLVEALAACLEAMRQGASLETALGKYPEYRAQLRALLEVASLIRPLAKDVVPSPALRKAIRACLTELRQQPDPPLFDTGGEPSEAC
jgi:hypothetical protein